jgi:pimeloyl-ACP methyl ester carboxylesterase
MLPPLGRGAADFDDLAARVVEAGFTAVRPEPRGAGGSTGPMTNVTLHDLATDVAAVIEALDCGPAIVLGHAFGQRVARVLATDRPDLVKGVVMLAAGGKIPMKQSAQQAMAGCFKFDAPAADRLRDIGIAFFAPGNDPSAWLDGWHSAVSKVQSAAGKATPVGDWWTAGTGTPILIVQGLQDAVAPPENGHVMKRELGDRVELVEIDGAGHALLPERPQAVADAVIAFVRRL